MEEQERVDTPEESPSMEPIEATASQDRDEFRRSQEVSGKATKKQMEALRKKSVFEKPENSIFSQKTELKYRLSLYRSNGTIRSDIKKATLTQAGAMYGDLMRCIPSNQWSTMDELCELVWEFERKSYRKSFTRTRRQIEEGVALLLEGDIVQSRAT